MNEQIKNLRKACDFVGGQTEMAKLLNVAAPTVNQWTTGIRPIPLGRMADIEKVTKGFISRKDLCAEWERHWPELASKQKNRHKS